MKFKLEITPDYWMTINDFLTLLKEGSCLKLGKEVLDSLDSTRGFIDYICSNDIKVYGITTGFGSLRKHFISHKLSSTLSKNLILSHDAGIGPPLPNEVTLGAMILRAHSLAKGYSGFSSEGLSTLVSMVNSRIIPEIPSHGSLGASGDLAFLARLGHAMMGGEVPVEYKGIKTSAPKALQTAEIQKFNPKSKEGLALINGTSFMASMIAIAYAREEALLENLFASIGIFLNAIGASPVPFFDSTQFVRNQCGQLIVARLIKPFFSKAELNSFDNIQDDYCIRCLPQVFGPRVEFILDQKVIIEREINAVTDNPLIFKDSQISPDVDPACRYSFNNENWAVLSGGNFHGENLTTAADGIALANAKFALTIERQITYMLNSWRNRNYLPDYLIPNPDQAGLKSGFMIPHYTANAIVHKICLLAQPSSLMNCTSGNESEDIVSYGATACNKLLDQIKLVDEILVIYLLTALQAYSISRENLDIKNEIVEEIFQDIQDQISFPILNDEDFRQKYNIISTFISSGKLRKLAGFPLEHITRNWPKFNGKASPSKPSAAMKPH